LLAAGAAASHGAAATGIRARLIGAALLLALPLGACGAQPADSEKPKQAASGAGQSAAFSLCPEAMTIADVDAARVDGRLILRASCLPEEGLEAQRREVVVDLPGMERSSGPHFLLDLSEPEFAGRRRVDFVSDEAGSRDFRLRTAAGQCRTLRATPLSETPGPRSQAGEDQLWSSALGFLANEDCSLLLVYFFNRAALFRGDRPSASRLYDLKISIPAGAA
jgi:hypothetical protein